MDILSAMSMLEGLESEDLIGMRTAAWGAGETGRAEVIDAELNRRLYVIMRGRSPAGTPVHSPEPRLRTLRNRNDGRADLFNVRHYPVTAVCRVCGQPIRADSFFWPFVHQEGE
jgi:hypothetical protein